MKKINIRRYIIMAVGIIIMGLGVSIFKFSLMGNDPCNAAYMAAADFIGIPFAIMSWIISGVWFILEITLGRKYIGAGTFVNWFCVGIISTFFTNIINRIFEQPQAFLIRLLILVVGILVLSLSVSLYQTANVGIAPYDAVSIILNEKTHVPYFWCRIFTDAICAVAAWLLGGIVGLGTLVCAFGLGPFVTMFDRLVSERLVKEEQISKER